jgi:sporulation protein YlmC with PRC-barrel domain
MELGRTLLDQQVIDAENHPMGKVDGVVIELRAGRPARVSHVVVGGTTLLWRIHRGLAAWAERRLGGEGRVTRIPWKQVVKIGVDVKVDVDRARTPAQHWEDWVRDRIIGRIPGA